MAGDPKRRVALAKIHVAKRLLRLSDELYRAIIARVTGGKRSSAALDAGERGRLLTELRRLGFQPGGQGALPAGDEAAACGDQVPLGDRPATEREPHAGAQAPHGAAQARKIRVLWRKLGKAAALRDASERGLRLFIRRQTGRDALEWLTAVEANQVIEGLKAWHRRVANQK